MRDKSHGNTYRVMAASNHTDRIREENDYYATDPVAGKFLLELESELSNIWECACGAGHLAKVFEEAGKLGKATDIVDRGYGNIENFLAETTPYHNGDIVTNPPYKLAQTFIEHALERVDEGRRVCMFLKVLFLESQSRKKLFTEQPPRYIYIYPAVE